MACVAQDIVLDGVTMHGNTLRSLTLSAHALQDAPNFEPISITVRNTVISGGSFGISINTSPKGVPAGSTLVLDGLEVRGTNGTGLLLEDKHKNLALSVQNVSSRVQHIRPGNSSIVHHQLDRATVHLCPPRPAHTHTLPCPATNTGASRLSECGQTVIGLLVRGCRAVATEHLSQRRHPGESSGRRAFPCVCVALGHFETRIWPMWRVVWLRK